MYLGLGYRSFKLWGSEKKNLNASRPPEHTSVRGKMSKHLSGIIDCKDKTSSWHLNGFPDGIIVALDQQYNVGEKPTVILQHPYINRHAGTPNKTKTMY